MSLSAEPFAVFERGNIYSGTPRLNRDFGYGLFLQ